MGHRSTIVKSNHIGLTCLISRDHWRTFYMTLLPVSPPVSMDRHQRLTVFPLKNPSAIFLWSLEVHYKRIRNLLLRPETSSPVELSYTLREEALKWSQDKTIIKAGSAKSCLLTLLRFIALATVGQCPLIQSHKQTGNMMLFDPKVIWNVSYIWLNFPRLFWHAIIII